MHGINKVTFVTTNLPCVKTY